MTRDVRSLYTPTERAVLSKYLRCTDPAPLDLIGIDVSQPVEPDDWDKRGGGIAPFASETGCDDLMLENAVARICLQPVQHRLPQWAAMSGRELTRGRARSTAAARRRRLLRPRHLFEINWGDSGPGFSWPEAYYLTRLPGYGVAVVTASADSPDTYGYCDFAIGWFWPSRRRPDDVARCICARWAALRRDGQARWAYLWDTGAVDATTAAAWADAVWPQVSGADGR